MAKAKTETVVSESKSIRIDEIKKKLEKKFGRGTIMGAIEKPRDHDYISTGSVGLDKALGIGGLPKGRIIEVYGPESSGKTTLCLEVIAQAHKNPESYCAIVDAEHAIDTAYAAALGIDLNRLEISQPDYGEQALEIASELIESGDFDVVVVDSVAALVPKSELDGEMGDQSMGKHARLMSQAMRKLTAITSKSNTILIFINQIREKIGVMFGNPETTTGGNALKFYASVRMDVRRSVTTANSVMDGDTKIGNQVTIKVLKNKVAPPFKEAKLDILYGQGFDDVGEIIDYAVSTDVLTKSGSWFSYEENKIAQGRDQLHQFLIDNPDLFEEIKSKTVSKLNDVRTEVINQEEKQEDTNSM